MRFGFTGEEEEYEETPNYGVGQAGSLSDNGDDDGWSFTDHVYIAIQIGPFAIVLGRPD